jgi:hypothetical protein
MVLGTGAPVHDGIVKIEDDLLCPTANTSELQRREESPVDVQKVIVPQRMIKPNLIRPRLLEKMDGSFHALFLQIGEILKDTVTAPAHFKAVDKKDSFHVDQVPTTPSS